MRLLGYTFRFGVEGEQRQEHDRGAQGLMGESITVSAAVEEQWAQRISMFDKVCSAIFI